LQGQLGQFAVVAQLNGIRSVAFEHWQEPANNKGEDVSVYLALVSEGSTDLSRTAAAVYRFGTSLPPPRPVVLVQQNLGPCDVLTVDARSTGGSGGRPFSTVLWSLLSFKTAQPVVTSPPYGVALSRLMATRELSLENNIEVPSFRNLRSVLS
jgi:hypothetical protein